MFWRKVLQIGVRWNCKTLTDQVRMKEDVVENVCLILTFIIFTSLFVLEDFNTWTPLPFPRIAPSHLSISYLRSVSNLSKIIAQNFLWHFPNHSPTYWPQWSDSH